MRDVPSQEHAALGAELRRWREACDIVQKDMAWRIGISRTHLTRLELGQLHWTAALRDKFLQALVGKENQ